MTTLSLACTCGELTGTLTIPPTGHRLVCYCDDCQTAGRYLGGACLDENGGTEVYQVAPAQVVLKGVEHLGCLRLSPKGIFRWYATCCRTPVANTLSYSWLAFSNIQRSFVADAAFDGLVGRVVGRANGRFGHGQLPAGTAPGASPGIVARMASKIGADTLLGRAKPSPFFDADGACSVQPTILDLAERDAHRPPPPI